MIKFDITTGENPIVMVV